MVVLAFRLSDSGRLPWTVALFLRERGLSPPSGALGLLTVDNIRRNIQQTFTRVELGYGWGDMKTANDSASSLKILICTAPGASLLRAP